MKDTDNIQEHMDVICSCGANIGQVDRVEGNTIKLTRSEGRHHWVPTAWIDRVDDSVHLNRNSEEVYGVWNKAPRATADV